MANDGAAHQVPQGRLAGFEQEDDEVRPFLPPRRGRGQAPVREVPPAPQEDPPPAIAAATPEPPAQSAPADVSPSPRRESGSRDTDSAEEGPDPIRPSNVQIPAALIPLVEARCKTDGVSHGELMIRALEATYPRLGELLGSPVTSGGSLFASRIARAPRSNEGPLTPLNHRLRVSDYATIDRIVTEFGASSRGHLITVALRDYLQP